jgi:hypothetical protein
MINKNAILDLTMENNGITLQLNYQPNNDLFDLFTAINSPNEHPYFHVSVLSEDFKQFGFSKYEQEQLYNLRVYGILDGDKNAVNLSSDYYPLPDNYKSYIQKKLNSAHNTKNLPSDFETRLFFGKVKPHITLGEWKNIKSNEEKFAYQRDDLPTSKHREKVLKFLVRLLCKYRHTITHIEYIKINVSDVSDLIKYNKYRTLNAYLDVRVQHPANITSYKSVIKPIVNEIINHKPVRTIAEDIPFNKLGFGFTQMFANFNSQKILKAANKSTGVSLDLWLKLLKTVFY